jgi:hypothetical protein
MTKNFVSEILILLRQAIINFSTRTEKYFSKGKAIPFQALTDPEGSRRMRLPDFKTIST